jgi:hypothetical protein
MKINLAQFDEQAKSELKNQLCLLADIKKNISELLEKRDRCLKALTPYLCPFKVGDVITNNNNFYAHNGSSFKIKEAYIQESYRDTLEWVIKVNLVKKDGTLGKEIKIDGFIWHESKRA